MERDPRSYGIEEVDFAVGPLFETTPSADSKEGVAYGQRYQVYTIDHSKQVTRDNGAVTPLVTVREEKRIIE